MKDLLLIVAHLLTTLAKLLGPGGHKTIQNTRALETAFKQIGVTDVSSHNLRKTFATRLLSRDAAITDVQHLLGHASVKTTEKAYAAFVKNERSSRRLICWISLW
jgi:integrase